MISTMRYSARELQVDDVIVTPKQLKADRPWYGERIEAVIVSIESRECAPAGRKVLVLENESGAQFTRVNDEVCLSNASAMALLREKYGDISEVNSDVFRAAIDIGATNELLLQLALGYPTRDRTADDHCEPLGLSFVEDMWDLEIPHDQIFDFTARVCVEKGPRGRAHRKAFWGDLRVASHFTVEQMMELTLGMCGVGADAVFTQANMENLASWLRCKGVQRSAVSSKLGSVADVAVQYIANFSERYQFEAFVNRASRETAAAWPRRAVLTYSGWNFLVAGMALQLNPKALVTWLGQSLELSIASEPKMAPMAYRWLVAGCGFASATDEERVEAINRLRAFYERRGWQFATLERNDYGLLGATVTAPSGVERFVCSTCTDSSLAEGDEVIVDVNMIPQAEMNEYCLPTLSMMQVDPATPEMQDAWWEYLLA